MKKAIGYILFGVFVAGFCTGTFFLVRQEKAVRHEISCNGISVEVPDTSRFITEDIACTLMEQRFDPFIGRRIDDIDLGLIERTFESQECVRDAEAWVTDDGILHVTVFQRVPVLRFTGNSREFYVDGDGNPFFCLNPGWSADVPSISGDVEKALDKGWISDMLNLVAALEKSPVCSRRIEGFESDADGFISIFLHGGTVVQAGRPGNHADIAGKMECYFRNIESIYGNSYYKKVNIKYKDQIVCRKDS